MFRRWICVVTTTAGRGRQKFGFQYEWVMTFAELFISAVRPVVIIYLEDHYSYLPGSSGTLSYLNIHTWLRSDYVLLCPIWPLSNKSVCSRWPSLAPLPHFIYFLSLHHPHEFFLSRQRCFWDPFLSSDGCLTQVLSGQNPQVVTDWYGTLGTAFVSPLQSGQLAKMMNNSVWRNFWQSQASKGGGVKNKGTIEMAKHVAASEESSRTVCLWIELGIPEVDRNWWSGMVSLLNKRMKPITGPLVPQDYDLGD